MISVELTMSRNTMRINKPKLTSLESSWNSCAQSLRLDSRAAAIVLEKTVSETIFYWVFNKIGIFDFDKILFKLGI